MSGLFFITIKPIYLYYVNCRIEMLYLFVGLIELIALVSSHYHQDAIYFMLGQIIVIAFISIVKFKIKIMNLIITSVLGVYVYNGMDISAIYVAYGTLVGLCTLLYVNLSNYIKAM